MSLQRFSLQPKQPLTPYSKKQIDRAGKTLVSRDVSQEEIKQAFVILNNWRAAHVSLLNAIASSLTSNNPNTIVVQRLKRLDSIIGKLRRFPQMSFSKMQDLGGCRVILDSIDQVYEVISQHKSSNKSFTLKKENDYIQNPKTSGYRSYHMVYQFNDYLLVEIQFRTYLQHLWATALEIMSIYMGTNLKAGVGQDDVLRFFLLVSSLFALKECTPVFPNTSNNPKELIAEIKELDNQFHILEKLSTMSAKFNPSNESKGYYLMELDTLTNKLEINYFPMNQAQEAIQLYKHMESLQIPIFNTVLVSASSFNTLKRAYPNYFLDARQFLSIMKEILSNECLFFLFLSHLFFIVN